MCLTEPEGTLEQDAEDIKERPNNITHQLYESWTKSIYSSTVSPSER